jgi:MFS family permease
MKDVVSVGEFNPRSIRAAIAAWIGMFIGPNAMVSAPMSLFIAPLTHEFGLTRTAVSSILVISPLSIALFSPFVGRAIDRFGLRQVLLPGILVFGLACMARGYVAHPWQLAVMFFIVSIGSAMNSAVGYAKLVSLWFSANRGRLIGIVVALGAGTGSTLAPQVVRVLIHNYDWRVAYIAMGAYIILLPLPILFFLIKEPAVAATTVHAPATMLPGLTRAEAVHTRAFWLLLPAIFLASMALIGTTAHAVPMLTERGFSSLIGTTAISCFFFGGIAGQLTSGYISDRIDSPRVAVPYFFLALVGAMIVHLATNTVVLLGGAVLMGMGQGAEIAFAAYLTSRYFGLRAYGSIYSLLFAASNVGIALGLISMGLVHDHAGSYRPMTYGFGAALAISLLLIVLLGPYRYASRKTLMAQSTGPADPSVAEARP